MSAASQQELADWLYLTLVPGVGPERQRALLAALGLPAQIRAASHSVLAQVIGDKLAEAFLSHPREAAIERALQWAQEPTNAIVCLADAAYPPSLLQTDDPPTLLYAKGDLALLQAAALAVVGSRNATTQGLNNAERFSQSLSEAGLTIVSGLALGIDAAAHRGALTQAGRTIAVIGTGADRVYPATNATLARQIAEHGLIISEFPLGTPAAAYNFPRRNRIISGLSRGVLVVEAAVGSGSLITARLALEQGREVFAIPGSIHSPLAKGCHALIKQGAKLVESAQDVLEELQWKAKTVSISGEKSSKSTQNAAKPVEPPDALLQTMGFDPISAEDLAVRSGLTSADLFAMLTLLELDGHIERLSGGLFQRLSA